MNVTRERTRLRKKKESNTTAHSPKTTDNPSAGNHGYKSPSTNNGPGIFHSTGPDFGLPGKPGPVFNQRDDPYEREAEAASQRFAAGLDVPGISRISPNSTVEPGIHTQSIDEERNSGQRRL